MPSGHPITQIWAKLRGIAHIWVNPQIWVIPESDHPELREITLGSPKIGRVAYSKGGHLMPQSHPTTGPVRF